MTSTRVSSAGDPSSRQPPLQGPCDTVSKPRATIVLPPTTTAEQMALVAEKVRLAVLNELTGQEPPVTISVGVAASSGRAIDSNALMARADSALYRAKDKGRNRVELAPEE